MANVMKKNLKKRNKKITTKDLVEQNRLLMDFMNNIPDVIYFKDKKGKLILVNKAHAKGLGLTPDQVVGKTDYDIFPKKRAAKMAKDDQRVIKTGKPIVDKIERATRADGIDNYVSTTKVPRYDQKGKIVGIVGITRDVTKRVHLEHLHEERVRIEKRLEMLEDLNKIKSEFISTVSHELRTPLAIIKQLLALLFNETVGPINDEQKEVLFKTKSNIERLKKIIDELLDISRIEGKGLKLHYSLVNINNLIKDSKDFFKRLADEKNITLTYSFPKKEINIFIDVERVVQVVSNLVNNAIKFTGENGKIKVELKILEDKLRVGVIDTGIGIAKQDVPKIFDKFIQVSRDSTEKKGVGLGLSIVKEIVERHGGEIWAESKLGIGSKFYFTLPRFYTTNVYGKKIKDKIKPFLEKGTPVCLINLLIVDYEEFKKRIDVGPRKLSKDLSSLIREVFKDFCKAEKKDYQIYITDMRRGKYNIIFPGVTDKKISEFFEFLKIGIKSYFIAHKIENVFIALGVVSYSSKSKSKAKKNDLQGLTIKEIYVGSEMRRAKRIDYVTRIETAQTSSNVHVSHTIDMSSHGVCFLSPKPLKTDAILKVRFELLKKQKTISAVARVAWLKKMEPLPGDVKVKYKTGLEFISFSDKDRKSFLQELKLYDE